MDNDGQWKWCWFGLQWINRQACEARIQKGTCKRLDAPQSIGRDREEFFNAEGETETCVRVGEKRERMGDK